VRRTLSVTFAVVLAAGVAAAIVWDRFGGGKDPVVVRGVIGSEKGPFFADPAVRAEFRKQGLDVQVDAVGSWQMTSVKLGEYAFAFPASAPAAERIQRQRETTKAYAPFYSPMVVATFTPVAELLARPGTGIARRAPDGHWVFDMKAYLAASAKGLRWNQIPDSGAYPSPNAVLVSTTQPRDSNSAAMYAAVVSELANGEAVVADDAQRQKVQPAVDAQFVKQGYLERTSEQPFESYLANGLNYKPLVWAYEAQFLGRVNAADPGMTADKVLAYPEPTVLSKHTLVPFDANGDKVGNLLMTNPELARLAARHGFRTADARAFAAANPAAPPTLASVVDPPAYQVLQAMLDAVAARYDGTGK